LDELEKFLGEELPEAIDEFMEQASKDIQKVTVRRARKIARDRLPSGGESYAKTIKSSVEGEATGASGSGRPGFDGGLTVTIFSDHQWAEAIEEGTRPHLIVPAGVAFNEGKEFKERLYHGTRASKTAMKEGLKPMNRVETEKRIRSILKKHGKSFNKEMKKRDLFERMMQEIRGSRHEELNKELGFKVRGPTSWVWGSRDPWIAKQYARGGPEKFALALEAAGIPNIEIHREMEKLGPPRVFEVDMSKDGIHPLRDPMNYPIGTGVPPSRLKLTKGKLPPTLHITKKLGPGGEAGDYPRYIDVNMHRRVVNHPGARPFKVFEDTFTYMDKQLDRILDKALKKVGLDE
jgi:hypothetical protein